MIGSPAGICPVTGSWPRDLPSTKPSARATAESKRAPPPMALTEDCHTLTRGGLSQPRGRERKLFDSDPEETAPGYTAEEQTNAARPVHLELGASLGGKGAKSRPL